MKRIGIVSFYDAKGVVDESVIYYIKALRSVALELIVVINGEICINGKKKLERIADELLIRENLGFDAGAYKSVLCNQNYMERFRKYDEIILSNDTCFGPFIKFSSIFDEMRHKNVDFWGMDYVENKVADYIQSYFLVFRSKTHIKLIDYFQKYINELEKDINNIYAQFEVGLFYYMRHQGFEFGYYCKSNLEVYKSPNYGLYKAHLPIMKKKCFEQGKYNHDNCIGALKYISQNFDYDIRLILDTALRKYRIDYNLEEEFLNTLEEREYFLWAADIDYNIIKNFCMENKRIYIYGAGIIARKLFWIYSHYIDEFLGFIVSDGETKGDYLYNYPVFYLSEISNREASILVGVNKKYTHEIRKCLYSYKNCLFLFASNS